MNFSAVCYGLRFAHLQKVHLKLTGSRIFAFAQRKSLHTSSLYQESRKNSNSAHKIFNMRPYDLSCRYIEETLYFLRVARGASLEGCEKSGECPPDRCRLSPSGRLTGWGYQAAEKAAMKDTRLVFRANCKPRTSRFLNA